MLTIDDVRESCRRAAAGKLNPVFEVTVLRDGDRIQVASFLDELETAESYLENLSKKVWGTDPEIRVNGSPIEITRSLSERIPARKPS